MNDALPLPLPTGKQLTRANLFGEEQRFDFTYGESPLASKIWLAYARAVGRRCPPVAEMLDKAIALGRRPLGNLHGKACSAGWYERRKLTYGEKRVREAVAREQRGERWALLQRQAG